MKAIICPKCGAEFSTHQGIGRRKLNLNVNNIYDALCNYRSVTLVAEELGCSRGYIYQVLGVEKIREITRK